MKQTEMANFVGDLARFTIGDSLANVDVRVTGVKRDERYNIEKDIIEGFVSLRLDISFLRSPRPTDKKSDVRKVARFKSTYFDGCFPSVRCGYENSTVLVAKRFGNDIDSSQPATPEVSKMVLDTDYVTSLCEGLLRDIANGFITDDTNRIVVVAEPEHGLEYFKVFVTRCDESDDLVVQVRDVFAYSDINHNSEFINRLAKLCGDKLGHRRVDGVTYEFTLDYLNS